MKKINKPCLVVLFLKFYSKYIQVEKLMDYSSKDMQWWFRLFHSHNLYTLFNYYSDYFIAIISTHFSTIIESYPQKWCLSIQEPHVQTQLENHAIDTASTTRVFQRNCWLGSLAQLLARFVDAIVGWVCRCNRQLGL